MRYLAAVLVLCIMACPQLSQTQSGQTLQSTTAPTAEHVSVAECPFAVDFFGKPTVTTNKAAGIAIINEAVFDNDHVKQALICGCDDTIHADNMTQSNANAFVDKMVREKHGDMVTISRE